MLEVEWWQNCIQSFLWRPTAAFQSQKPTISDRKTHVHNYVLLAGECVFMQQTHKNKSKKSDSRKIERNRARERRGMNDFNVCTASIWIAKLPIRQQKRRLLLFNHFRCTSENADFFFFFFFFVLFFYALTHGEWIEGSMTVMARRTQFMYMNVAKWIKTTQMLHKIRYKSESKMQECVVKKMISVLVLRHVIIFGKLNSKATWILTVSHCWWTFFLINYGKRDCHFTRISCVRNGYLK